MDMFGHYVQLRDLPTGHWWMAAERCANGKPSCPSSALPSDCELCPLDFDGEAQTARPWLVRERIDPPPWNRSPISTQVTLACLRRPLQSARRYSPGY